MRTPVALAVLALSHAAFASGHSRASDGVAFQRGDPASIYVATTFGLLISHDDGCSFRWVCETSLGVGGDYEPRYRIAQDGTIFATTYDGLRISRDGGCTFTTAGGAIAGAWIDAIDLGPTGDVWVTTADGRRPNDVFRSTDNGATFESRGLLSRTIWWKSVAVAPSDASRAYASGYEVAGRAPTAHVMRSDDAGAHWTELSLTGVAFGTTPLIYVLAVDPEHPDTLFVVSSGARAPGGDRLYRSIDGGRAWTEVLTTAAAIRSVAIAPGGRVWAAASGQGFASRDDGATFAPIDEPLTCVGRRDDGALFGCTSGEAVLARSSDDHPWQSVLGLGQIAGPVACPEGTRDRSCGQQWPALARELGAKSPSCPARPRPTTTRAGRSGCCDAGADGPLTAILALLVARRARRRDGSARSPVTGR